MKPNQRENTESAALRQGFTTGSCAAAAAKAATWMLLSGAEKQTITVHTPKGPVYQAAVVDVMRTTESVRCAVIKDGGDDPDITTDAHITAEVSFPGSEEPEEGHRPQVQILGGPGVGRITRPGLDRKPGEAAINSVPREMIRREVLDVLEAFACPRDIQVTISVPGGEELARKTFNERLGIEGGISIIGTTGIVEPMSQQAVLDTIRLELQQRRAEGEWLVSITPGNYGLRFMEETYAFDLSCSVKCSNYIGRTLDMAAELGFTQVLLTGHSGKLVKVAGGIWNTHSRVADCRLEILTAAALQEGVETALLHQVMESRTTEEAFALLDKKGLAKQVAARLVQQMDARIQKRVGTKMRVECLLYTVELGQLAATEGALDLLQTLRENGYEK